MEADDGLELFLPSFKRVFIVGFPNEPGDEVDEAQVFVGDLDRWLLGTEVLVVIEELK